MTYVLYYKGIKPVLHIIGMSKVSQAEMAKARKKDICWKYRVLVNIEIGICALFIGLSITVKVT